jgi:hypothetical protein
MDDTVLLTATASQEETLVLQSLLGSAGIKFLLQRSDSGAFTKFTGTFGGTRFFVRKDQLEDAKGILAEFQSSGASEK